MKYNEEMSAVAGYANLTPRAAELLQKFLLELASQQDKDELDEWLNESEANERLFDLLLEKTRGGVGAGILKFLMDHTKKEPVKKSKIKFWLNRIAIGIIIALVLDYIIPSHPLSTLILGDEEPNFVTKTVEAGDSVKVVWMYPDSTRIELQPHSKLGYSKNLYWYDRKVQLWGTAKFFVTPSKDGWFKVKYGKLWVELPKGSFTLVGDSAHPIVQEYKP